MEKENDDRQIRGGERIKKNGEEKRKKEYKKVERRKIEMRTEGKRRRERVGMQENRRCQSYKSNN